MENCRVYERMICYYYMTGTGGGAKCGKGVTQDEEMREDGGVVGNIDLALPLIDENEEEEEKNRQRLSIYSIW